VSVRHFGTSAEMSWVQSVLGPKCLDTYKVPLTGSYAVILTVGDMYATDVLILLLWRPNFY